MGKDELLMFLQNLGRLLLLVPHSSLSTRSQQLYLAGSQAVPYAALLWVSFIAVNGDVTTNDSKHSYQAALLGSLMLYISFNWSHTPARKAY